MGAKPGWTTSVDSKGERHWRHGGLKMVSVDLEKLRKLEAGLAMACNDESADLIRGVREELTCLRTELAEANARIAGLEAQLRHMHTFDGQHRARIADLEFRLTEQHKATTALCDNRDARITKLEDLVADQKAATDEEFQNCSKIEAELAEAKARIAELEEQDNGEKKESAP